MREFWYGSTRRNAMFVDRINFMLKSQHKLQFILSK